MKNLKEEYTYDQNDLNNKIVKLKEKIYYLIDNSDSITDCEVICASQELDKLINLEMRNKL